MSIGSFAKKCGGARVARGIWGARRKVTVVVVTLVVLVSTGAMYVGMTSASLPVSGSTIVIGSRSPGSIVSAGPIPGLTAEVADASDSNSGACSTPCPSG